MEWPRPEHHHLFRVNATPPQKTDASRCPRKRGSCPRTCTRTPPVPVGFGSISRAARARARDRGRLDDRAIITLQAQLFRARAVQRTIASIGAATERLDPISVRLDDADLAWAAETGRALRGAGAGRDRPRPVA